MRHKVAAYALLKNQKGFSKMNRKKTIIIGTLSVLLVVTMLTWAKQLVERPMKGRGAAILEITEVTTDGTVWIWEETGNMTHVGRFTNSAAGFTGNDGHGYASGQLTAANGDEIFYATEITPGHEVADIITVTGGTGRFENAGGTVYVLINEVLSQEFPIYEYGTTYEGTIIY